MVEGAHEWEVTQAGVTAMIAALSDTWGEKAELLDTWAWLQSGPINTDGAHNPTTNRRLERGDIMTLNCFPMAQVFFEGWPLLHIYVMCDAQPETLISGKCDP